MNRTLQVLVAFFVLLPVKGQTVPVPTHANIDYAPADPQGSAGHKLDLYLPKDISRPAPIAIWTAGSAFLADNGKDSAGRLAGQLIDAGYALVGVSIRSSSQVKFPGQLHDIKAAIRWLRVNATMYNLDPGHIAVLGTSSGGWAAAMAATTGDVPELEGSVGVKEGSSRIQAAVAFAPSTNFLVMDEWLPRPCVQKSSGREWQAGDCFSGRADSPASLVMGCVIETCPEKVAAADPVRYISADDPPVMILHGESDPAVPHNQGERLYMALNKACRNAVFISLPKAEHGPMRAYLSENATREGATIRSTSAAGCVVQNPTLHTPSWQTILDFLDKYMK